MFSLELRDYMQEGALPPHPPSTDGSNHTTLPRGEDDDGKKPAQFWYSQHLVLDYVITGKSGLCPQRGRQKHCTVIPFCVGRMVIGHGKKPAQFRYNQRLVLECETIGKRGFCPPRMDGSNVILYYFTVWGG